MSDSLHLAKVCAKAAHDIQAEDIRVLDLRGISTLTDFMVVCSGTSMPHLKAIMRDVEQLVSEHGKESPQYNEGRADSRWVILDYITVMVHIMHEEMRDFYTLEVLWGDGKELDLAEVFATQKPTS